MESMDYSNYFAPAPHTYGYMGFGSDSNVLGNNAGNSDNHNAIQVRRGQECELQSKSARVPPLNPV